MEDVSPFDNPSVPVEVTELLARVYEGLDEADLGPLEQYLRSGFPMFSDLREQLALCIQTGQVIAARPSKAGPSDATRQAAFDRRMRCGAYILVRMERSSRGSRDRIVHQAATRFGVSESAAKAAYLEFKSAWQDPEGGRFVGAPFWGQALAQLCEEVGASFEDELERLRSDKS